jgi:hypothetical protein
VNTSDISPDTGRKDHQSLRSYLWLALAGRSAALDAEAEEDVEVAEGKSPLPWGLPLLAGLTTEE